MRNMQVGVNIDISHPAGTPEISQLQQWNVDWVRLSFKTGNGSLYTDWVEEIYASGIKVLMIMGYETLHGSPRFDANDSVWYGYIETLAGRCGRLAEQFGDKVSAYQIWNEPDLIQPSPDYDTRVRPEIYAHLVWRVTEEIKPHTRANIIGAGLVSGDPNWWRSVDPHLQPHTINAIAVHPYGQRPSQEWPSPDWGFGVLPDLIRRYQALGHDVWVTELGTNDIQNQERFPIHALWAVDDLCPVSFWFCYSDGMVNPFGLLDENQNAKPCLQYFLDYSLEQLESDECASEFERGYRIGWNDAMSKMKECISHMEP